MASNTAPALGLNHLGSVLEVTLNRPDVRNALDESLVGELTACVTEAGEHGCRALVLRGAGPVFCAGADLAWMARAAAYSRERNIEDARSLQRLFAAIAHFPGVTIAVVHGAAMGGGVGLVAACDIAIAAESSWFALTEVRLGLAPAVIAPYVIEKMGAGAARSLFVTGERFSAPEAMRLGLVHHIVADSSACELQLAATVAAVLTAGPIAVAAAKQLIRDIDGMTPDEAAEMTAASIAGLRAGAEGREGIQAFLEKRRATFVETAPVLGSS